MNKSSIAIGVLAGILIGVGLLFVFRPVVTPKAGNVITQGIVPAVSSNSIKQVGPQNTLTVASAATNCASRILSTASTSIMLSFSSGLTPSGTAGMWQAASTTVTYDNAVYGCGAITAYSSSSSTITVLTTAQ